MKKNIKKTITCHGWSTCVLGVHVSLRFSAVGTNNRNRKYWVHTPADGPQIIAVDSPYSTLDARIKNRVRTCTATVHSLCAFTVHSSCTFTVHSSCTARA